MLSNDAEREDARIKSIIPLDFANYTYNGEPLPEQMTNSSDSQSANLDVAHQSTAIEIARLQCDSPSLHRNLKTDEEVVQFLKTLEKNVAAGRLPVESIRKILSESLEKIQAMSSRQMITGV